MVLGDNVSEAFELKVDLFQLGGTLDQGIT